MAIFKILIKIFKKIGKLFSRGGGKGASPESDRLPGERRIGIYGPSNVGKSVFFTMLYKACRQDREFNLSPEDPQTGLQLKTNLDTLRSGEWLPGTVEESELNFKASLKGGSQFPFSTRDYKGETVDLEQEGAARAKLIEYFRSCDAILFLISPEMIEDTRKCEREIMSFTAMINQVTDESGKGLKIPIGLMITKADEMEGFENQSQVTLVGRKAEYLKAKDFHTFVDGMCGQYHVARNIVFQEQVRETLGKLSLFFDFLMTLSMEFQVFFVSSVGHVRKVEDTPGHMVSRPPEDPDGIGVKTPFLWVIDTIKRKERIARINAARRFVFTVSLILLLFFAIPYSIHLLSSRDSVDDMMDVRANSQTVEDELDRYANSLGVRLVSGFFAIPGTQAGDTRARAHKLTSYWQAHRYIDEVLPDVEGAEGLGKLTEEYNGNGWVDASKPEWWDFLSQIQQDQFRDAATFRVAEHNDLVASELERFLQGRSIGLELVEGDSARTCDTFVERLIQPPSRRDEFESLRRDAVVRCEILESQGAERGLLNSARKMFRDSLEPFARRTVGPSDVDAAQAAVDAFLEASASTRDASVMQQRTRAEMLDLILDRVMRALRDLADGQDRPYRRELDRLRSDTRSEFPDVHDWAQSRLRAMSEQAAGEQFDELKAVFEPILSDPARFHELLSENRRQRLVSSNLSSQFKSGVEVYDKALKQLRDNGVRMRLDVDAAPDGYVVIWFDPEMQGFREDQAMAGSSLEVQWYADQPFTIGLLERGKTINQACGREEVDLRDFLAGKADVQFFDCPATNSVPASVRMPELQRELDDRLVRPLRDIFGL